MVHVYKSVYDLTAICMQNYDWFVNNETMKILVCAKKLVEANKRCRHMPSHETLPLNKTPKKKPISHLQFPQIHVLYIIILKQ